MQAKVAPLMKAPRNVNLDAGATVREALAAAGVDNVSGTSLVKMNGVSVSLDDEVPSGATIQIVQRVEGGGVL